MAMAAANTMGAQFDVPNRWNRIFTLLHPAYSVKAPTGPSSRKSIFPVFPHIQTPPHLQKVIGQE